MRQISKAVVKQVKCFQLNAAEAAAGVYGGCRPAFLVTFSDNTKLVMKAEYDAHSSPATAAISAKWAGKLMGKVNADVSAKLMTLHELEQVQQMSLAQFFPPAQVTRDYISWLVRQGKSVFYKMPFVGGMVSAEILSEQGSADILIALRAAGNEIFELGRITAADVFSNNNDRFDFRTPPNVFLNDSNLLFKQNGGSLLPVGVDFYHAESSASNLMVPPAPDWIGQRLQSKVTQRYLTDRVIACLNAYFKRKFKGITDAELLGDDAAEMFLSGLARGAADLRAYLFKRQNNQVKPMPVGVLKRMQFLGWDQPLNAPAPLRPATPPRTFVTARPTGPRPQYT